MNKEMMMLDDLIADLEEPVEVCSDGGNVGGFACRFVLGVIFPELN